MCQKINNAINYISPFSDGYKETAKKFLGENITGWERVKVIAATAAAVFAGFFIFAVGAGIGGLWAFRSMTERYVKIIDPKRAGEGGGAASVADQVNSFVIPSIVITEVPDNEESDIDDEFGSSSEGGFDADDASLLSNSEREKGAGVQIEPIIEMPEDLSVNSVIPLMVEEKVAPTTFEEYTLEEQEAYIQTIQDAHKGYRDTRDNKKAYKRHLIQLHQNFMEEFEQAKVKALKVHKKYKKKFEKLPKTGRNGITVSTLTQFKYAQRLLDKKFSWLTSLAFDLPFGPEQEKGVQKRAVAHLMQVIMCGESVVNRELPHSPQCFAFYELKGKTTQEVSEEIEEYSNAFISKYRRPRSETADEYYKSVFLEAVALFARDCMKAGGLFSFGIGQSPKELLHHDSGDPAIAAKMIRDQLLQEFTENPAGIQGMIDAAKAEGSFVDNLRRIFSDCIEDDEELLPESILEAALENPKKLYSNDKVLGKAFDRLVKYCRIDEDVIGQLVEDSGCNPNDIKSLVRIRFLQVILLINQNEQDNEATALFHHMKLGEEQEYFDVLQFKGITTEYTAPSDRLLQDMESIATYGVGVDLNSPMQEGICEHFVNGPLRLAEVEVSKKLTGFTSAKGERKMISMQNLRVSWQISRNILNHLVAQIDPEAVLAQPEERYSLLREDLEKDLIFLKNLENSRQNAPQDVMQILQGVVNIQQHCLEFMDVASLLGKKEKNDLEPLKMISKELRNAYDLLATFKAFYVKDNSEDQVLLLDDALRTANLLIKQLPRPECFRSDWDRFIGVFGQSKEADEIAWKVRKYETQILQLRKHFESKFNEILNPMEQESEESLNMSGLSESLFRSAVFVDINEKEVVAQLYEILTKIEISFEEGRFNQEYLDELRGVMNREFIPTFRKLYEMNEKNRYLHQIANILFTEVVLEDVCAQTLDTFNKMGAWILRQELRDLDEDAPGEHKFVKRVHTVYNRIVAVPYSAKAPLMHQWWNSLKGHFNIGFDPYVQGNPTHHFWNLKVGNKIVKMLGMGTPTIENVGESPRINPEFEALMRHYQAEGNKHLYVSYQNFIPKNKGGDETTRCRLIFELMEKFEGTFFAMALSKNSEFYWQKGEWKEQDNAKIFKANLFEQVFSGDPEATGNFIPKDVRKLIAEDADAFNDKANGMINEIHQTLFKGRESLSLEERKWFIELFYDSLEKLVIAEGKMDSVNKSCKDQIDRGAQANAQLCANCYIVNAKNGKLTKKQKKHVMRLMMVRALLVRKRAPIHERVVRFAEGMDMSFKHVKELKALHENLFPKTPFIPSIVAAVSA